MVSLAVVFPLVVPFGSVPDLLDKFKFFEEDDGVGLLVGEEILDLLPALGVYTLGVLIVETEGLLMVLLVKFDWDMVVELLLIP